MPKDSKNGFYRQEQNIGRLISPLLRGRLRRTQSAAPRGAVHRAHTMAVYAARTARAPLR